MPLKTRTIKVGELARVEGEGALTLRIRGTTVEQAQLQIFESPRFFEALLRGRDFSEAPDITARICGICPVAYQMSAVQALEAALGVDPGPEIANLRRLLYCGEWIESHALHLFLLHAPDFLGYPGVAEMAAEHGELVNQGLALKRAGNALLRVLGGREIHPVNVRVGGFYRAPSVAEMAPVREELAGLRAAAEATVRFAAALDFPQLAPDYEFVSLRDELEYPMNRGRLISSRGLDCAVADFNQHFIEHQVEHSHALHCRRDNGNAYLVGPMARYNLNFDRLPAPIRRLAEELGFAPPICNPFQSIVIRGLELLFAIDEALRLLADYSPPEPAHVPLRPKQAEGHGCTEAPRGILYHRYALAADGSILCAQIVPPTSQNQLRIEQDLQAFAQNHLALPDAELQWRCEQAIRNYDPCISCATHFLQLYMDRDGC